MIHRLIIALLLATGLQVIGLADPATACRPIPGSASSLQTCKEINRDREPKAPVQRPQEKQERAEKPAPREGRDKLPQAPTPPSTPVQASLGVTG